VKEHYTLRLPKSEFSPEFAAWARDRGHIIQLIDGDVSWVNGLASNGPGQEWVYDVLDILDIQFSGSDWGKELASAHLGSVGD